MKRDLFTHHKRIRESDVKRDLCIQQDSSIYTSKEIYRHQKRSIRIKRDLYTHYKCKYTLYATETESIRRQKRPLHSTKEI